MQCGLDTAKICLSNVIDTTTMDRPTCYEHLDLCESTLYSASNLNIHGLPYDFASFHFSDPPSCCPTCDPALMDPLQPEPLHTRRFT